MKSLSSVAVVGASGYVGFELAKLLLKHPAVGELTFYVRNGTDDGESRLSEIFPHLRGGRDAPCRRFDLQGVTSDGYGAVLLATPHELSLEIVPSLLAAGLRVIDLSGAFRFRSPQTFSQWYRLPAPDSSLARRAVYGLPELYASSLPDADLVANPGCYATSVILGLRPLVESGWLAAERGIVCDLGLFDPPYSPRQVSEHYRSIGREVGQKDTQTSALYSRIRKALDPIIRPGGIVLSFGWHSNGMGPQYEIQEVVLVAHGSAHNDTICIAERKRTA